MQFDVELKLFRFLSQLQALEPLDANMQGWYNSYSNTAVAKFVQFESNWKNAISLSSNDQLTIDQNRDEAKSLRDEINNIQWQSIDNHNRTVVVNESNKALIETKKLVLKQKLANISAILTAKHQDFIAQVVSLSSLNQSNTTQATVSGQNLQTVNGLLVKRFSSTFEGFNESEIQTLRSIANQCAGEGGEGVFHARSLLAEYGKKEMVEYDDECIQVIGLRENQHSKPNQSTDKITVLPNPVIDKASVVLPKNNTFNSISIVDVFGKTIETYDVSQQQEQLEINVEGFSSGIYFLAAQGVQSQVIKFVVAK